MSDRVAFVTPNLRVLAMNDNDIDYWTVKSFSSHLNTNSLSWPCLVWTWSEANRAQKCLWMYTSLFNESWTSPFATCYLATDHGHINRSNGVDDFSIALCIIVYLEKGDCTIILLRRIRAKWFSSIPHPVKKCLVVLRASIGLIKYLYVSKWLRGPVIV